MTEADRAPRVAPASAGGAAPTVRRLLVLGILFVLLMVAASGASGLLTRALEAGQRTLAGDDLPGLARSLAFTLIATPLAAVLWAVQWRRLRVGMERASVLWSLYVAATQTVALITFVLALLAGCAELVRGDWSASSFGTATVWFLVWAVHRWAWRHPERGPTRIRTLVPTLGWFVGLVLAVGGAIVAIASLIDTAVVEFGGLLLSGEPWWRATLSALVWSAGGAAVWAWHWFTERGRALDTGFARVAIVAVSGIGAILLGLGGLATALFIALRLVFDRDAPATEALAPLGLALACASGGGIVWAYYRTVPALRSRRTREYVRLAASGVTLVATASGIGVIANSALAALVTPLAGSGTLLLLLGGVSALLVGGPVWWRLWLHDRPEADDGVEADTAVARRVYLVIVFGASAIVAIVTLLVIGYRIFELVLDDAGGQSLLDRVRAPLGLLLATGLAAGYHFALWTRERAADADAPAPPPPSIARVTLVTGARADPSLARAVETATGAVVVVWATVQDRDGDGHGGYAGAGTPTDAMVVDALRDIVADHVLVLVGPAGRLEVIVLDGTGAGRVGADR